MTNLTEYRTKVLALEEAIKADPALEQLDPDGLTTHWFCEGVYMRQLKVPKGFVVTGKIHRHACINILLQGKIRIALTDGSQVTMEAPHVFISEPGEKKAGFALEDTLWLNVHAVGQERELSVIEKHVIVPSYEALEAEKAVELLEAEG